MSLNGYATVARSDFEFTSKFEIAHIHSPECANNEAQQHKKVQLNKPYGKYFSTSVNFVNARVYLLDFKNG